MTFKATMTWGIGPDVLLDLSNGMFILYEDPRDFNRFKYGSVTSGGADLTAVEALTLGCALITAANQALELEQQCYDHDNQSTTTFLKKRGDD